ncbi:MAG: hypothetical protein HC929_18445 [Leptolyngbyaceae cyanobacterium SM2_5_2]|nr:hypothetical protein [Leptolyngbyaceae cyanobacterium SM2_5_2]
MAQHRDTSGRYSYQEPDPHLGTSEVPGFSRPPSPADLETTSPRPPKAARYDPLADLRQQIDDAAQPSRWAFQSSLPPAAFSLGKRLAKSWPIWSLAGLAVVSGIGIMSAISLFRIPNLPNCRAIFWPTASATTRLQCAEAYAEQATVDGYVEAIALLDSLPADHPLRSEINLRIEEWSENILDLAENAFQSGQLQAAIGMARRIPNHTAAAQIVSERVSEWNQIWQEAETIYEAAETELKNLEFQNAFSQATQLLTVGNDYWETVKYDELSRKITAAREDLNKLGQAKRLAEKRTLAAMQEALEIAQAIPSDSPVYAEAQRVMRDFGRDLLNMAEVALENRNADGARQMLDAIPAGVNLGEEIADLRTIIDASQLSWQGGMAGLEGAIVRLQSLSQDRPLYAKAQTLMRRWQAEARGDRS